MSINSFLMLEKDEYTGEFVKPTTIEIGDITVNVEETTYKPSSDGKLFVKSLYPEMSVNVSEEGFELSATYNSDLNKTINKIRAFDQAFVKDGILTCADAETRDSTAKYIGADLQGGIIKNGKISFSFENLIAGSEISEVLMVLSKLGCYDTGDITGGALHLTVTPKYSKIDFFRYPFELADGNIEKNYIATAYRRGYVSGELIPNKEYSFSVVYKEFYFSDVVSCVKFTFPDSYELLITDKILNISDVAEGFITANTEQIVWTSLQNDMNESINAELSANDKEKMAEGSELAYATVKEWWEDYSGQYVIFEMTHQKGSKAKGYFTKWMASSVDENKNIRYLRHDFNKQSNDGVLTTAPTGQNYVLFSNEVYGGTPI